MFLEISKMEFCSNLFPAFMCLFSRGRKVVFTSWPQLALQSHQHTSASVRGRIFSNWSWNSGTREMTSPVFSVPQTFTFRGFMFFCYFKSYTSLALPSSCCQYVGVLLLYVFKSLNFEGWSWTEFHCWIFFFPSEEKYKINETFAVRLNFVLWTSVVYLGCQFFTFLYCVCKGKKMFL